MRDLLHGLFVRDALLKGVSILAATILFVIVRGDKDAATSAYVKIIYVLPKDRVLVSDPAGELRLGIRGPWTRVSHFDERDLDPVRIDLSTVGSGDFHFNESMIRLPVGLRLASISPATVRLRIEPRIERMVPIQPILSGEPAVGYRVLRSQAHPRDVRVAGAKSVVEAIHRVPTRPLPIADARAPLHGQIPLDVPPPHAVFEREDDVSVDVEIVPALAEHFVRAIPIRATGLGRLDARVEPDVADVILRGPAEALAVVPTGGPSLIIDAQAEDTRPPGAFRKRISVVGLPTGVAAEVRPESVTLVTRRRRY